MIRRDTSLFAGTGITTFWYRNYHISQCRRAVYTMSLAGEHARLPARTDAKRPWATGVRDGEWALLSQLDHSRCTHKGAVRLGLPCVRARKDA